MVNIQLKAKHFYFVTYQLRNSSINQYFSLISRIKTVLAGNSDFDALFSVSASPTEVITMYRTLTVLPEGVANQINIEMDNLLLPQIVSGVTDEQTAGIGPDAEGNLPENAYWQIIGQGITEIKDSNTAARDAAITNGKTLIDQI
jgi:hypothetical protein